jgi:hypothetical protein
LNYITAAWVNTPAALVVVLVAWFWRTQPLTSLPSSVAARNEDQRSGNGYFDSKARCLHFLHFFKANTYKACNQKNSHQG